MRFVTLQAMDTVHERFNASLQALQTTAAASDQAVRLMLKINLHYSRCCEHHSQPNPHHQTLCAVAGVGGMHNIAKVTLTHRRTCRSCMRCARAALSACRPSNAVSCRVRAARTDSSASSAAASCAIAAALMRSEACTDHTHAKGRLHCAAAAVPEHLPLSCFLTNLPRMHKIDALTQ